MHGNTNTTSERPKISFEYRPYPKRKRIVSPETIEAVRKRDGRCMAPFLEDYEKLPRILLQCSAGIDVHHIISKGVGGDDAPENLIALCRAHHNLTETRDIKPQQLQKLLSRIYGYRYDS